MFDEHKTKLILEGEARGMDKVIDAVEQIVGAVGDGGGTKPSAFAALEKSLSSITSSLGKLQDAVNKISKGANEISKISGGGGGSKGPRSEGASRPEPSFTRGLLQGVGLGQYFPGANRAELARQAAGVAVGRGAAGAARGVGGGVFGSAFTGIGGISQAISSLPGGGIAAGMANAAISSVEDALALQRAQQEAAPFLNLRRGRRASASASESLWQSDYQPDVIASRARKAGLAAQNSLIGNIHGPEDPGAVREWPGAFGIKTEELQKAAGTSGEPSWMRDARLQGEEKYREEAASRRKGSLAQAAGRAYGEAVYGGGGFIGLGERHGLDQTELTGQLSQFMRARGGTFGQSARGGLRTALAGQTTFGVDVGTSGELVYGARKGAMSNSGGDSTTLVNLYAKAFELGLTKSEMAPAMKSLAAKVGQFDASGTTLGADSTFGVAKSLAGSGMSPSIAFGRSQAFTAAVQGRARAGLPGTSGDFASLVHLGGYNGGGAEEAFAARARLARGDFKSGGFDELTKLFAGQINTGPGGRSYGVEQGFKSLGLELNPDEASALEGGGPERAKVLALLERRAKRKISNVGDIENMGEGAVGGGLQRQASIRNKRIGAGQEVMTVVQDFETRAADSAKTMGKLVDKLRILNPLLDGLVDKFDELATSLVGNGVTPKPGR